MYAIRSYYAEIIECYITDDSGVKTTAVMKSEEFTVNMKVLFRETVPAPIFAFSIKDIKGTEITGTNTMFEKVFPSSSKEGDRITSYNVCYTKLLREYDQNRTQEHGQQCHQVYCQGREYLYFLRNRR